MSKVLRQSLSVLLATAIAVDPLYSAAAFSHSPRPTYSSQASLFTEQAFNPVLSFSWVGLGRANAMVKRWTGSLSKRAIPDSLALAGRHGFNDLKWPAKPQAIEAKDAALKWLWAELPPAVVKELEFEITRQGITLHATHDPEGALMRRKGNQILINTARPDTTAAVRETALRHDVLGHDWDKVMKLLKAKEFNPEDADIYEGYAMAVAEFRHVEARQERVQAVLNAFATLGALDDSSLNGKTQSLRELTKKGLSDERRVVVMKTLEALLPDSPKEDSDDAAWERFKGHLRDLTNLGLEVIPTWTGSTHYWATTLRDITPSRWWLKIAMETAFSLSRSQTLREYTTNIDYLISAVEYFRAPPKVTAENRVKVIRTLLKYRLDLLRFRQNVLEQGIHQLKEFANYYPDLKDDMLSEIEAIASAQRKADLPKEIPMTDAIFIEIALQTIGALPLYEQAAEIAMRNAAKPLASGSSIPTKAKSSQTWIGLLTFNGLTTSLVARHGHALASRMSVAAARSATPAEFEDRSKQLLVASGFNRRVLVLTPEQDDWVLVRNLFAIQSLALEYQVDVKPEDLLTLRDAVLKKAPTLSGPVEELYEKVEAAFNALRHPTPEEAASAIRKTLGINSVDEAIMLLGPMMATASPAPLARIDPTSIQSLSARQRGETYLDAFIARVRQGEIDLQDASSGYKWANTMGVDRDAAQAVAQTIDLYAAAARRSHTRLEFAQAIEATRLRFTILDNLTPAPVASRQEAWEFAKNLVRAQLEKLQGRSQWDDIYPFMSPSGWVRFLDRYESAFDRRLDIESFVAVEIGWPLLTPVQRTAIEKPIPGKGLNPPEYTRLVLASLDRRVLTDKAQAPRSRGLSAMLAIAKELAASGSTTSSPTRQDDPNAPARFHFRDLTGWEYALNDREAYRAVRKELDLLVEFWNPDTILQDTEELVDAARVLEAPLPQSGGKEETAALKALLKAHLVYARISSKDASGMQRKLTERLSDQAKVPAVAELLAPIAKALNQDPRNSPTTAFSLALESIGLGLSHEEKAHAFFRSYVASIKALKELPNLRTSIPWMEAFKKAHKYDAKLMEAAEKEAEFLGAITNRKVDSREAAIQNMEEVLAAWEIVVLDKSDSVTKEALAKRMESVLVLMPYLSSGPSEGDSAFIKRASTTILAWVPDAIRPKMLELSDEAFNDSMQAQFGKAQTYRQARTTLTRFLANEKGPEADEALRQGQTALQKAVADLIASGDLEMLKKAEHMSGWLEWMSGDARALMAVRLDIGHYTDAAIASRTKPQPIQAFAQFAADIAAYNAILAGPASQGTTREDAEQIAMARIGLMLFEGQRNWSGIQGSLGRAFEKTKVPEDVQKMLIDRLAAEVQHRTNQLDAYAKYNLEAKGPLTPNELLLILRAYLGGIPSLNAQAVEHMATRMTAILKQSSFPRDFVFAEGNAQRVLAAAAQDDIKSVDTSYHQGLRNGKDQNRSGQETALKARVGATLAAMRMLYEPSRGGETPEQTALRRFRAMLTIMESTPIPSADVIKGATLKQRITHLRSYLLASFPEMEDLFEPLWQKAAEGYTGGNLAADFTPYARAQLGLEPIEPQIDKPTSFFGDEISWAPVLRALLELRQHDSWNRLVHTLARLLPTDNMLGHSGQSAFIQTLLNAQNLFELARALNPWLTIPNALMAILDAVRDRIGDRNEELRFRDNVQTLALQEALELFKAARYDIPNVVVHTIQQPVTHSANILGNGALQKLILVTKDSDGVMHVVISQDAADYLTTLAEGGELTTAFLVVLQHEAMRMAGMSHEQVVLAGWGEDHIPLASFAPPTDFVKTITPPTRRLSLRRRALARAA